MNSKSHIPGETPPPYKRYRPFLLVVLFFSLYLAFLILRPFLHTIILAIVLASLFHPLQVWLVRLYRGRRNAAALTVVVAITFLIIIPVFFFISALVNQGVESINRIDEWISAGNIQEILEHPKIMAYTAWIRKHLEISQSTEIDLQAHLLQLSKTIGQFLLSRGAGLMRDIASTVFHFFVMIFLAFYLLRDGEDMLRGIKGLSPLREDQENRILDKIRVVARSALLGNFLTAVCQGVAGGIGLAIVGIPAIFWGTLMGFSSLIPIVGTSIVWIPAVGYLLLLGRWKSAIFLALWSIFLVSTMDNFLRPFLMRGQARMSPFYIFLAIMGGISYFGVAGILYGPLILGFATVMLYIYQVEYKDLLDKKEITD
ncbi:MAG: AI-2E family transporter [Desulfatiglandales bacterium]